MRVFRRAGPATRDVVRTAHRSAGGCVQALRNAPRRVRSTALTATLLLVVTAASLVSCTSGTTVPGPERPGTVVSLTFNEGTATQYANARPLLRRYDLHGTFYVTPGRIDGGDPFYMNWDEIRRLYREGDEIGSSSADGEDLTVPWDPDPARDYAEKREQVCRAHERLSELGVDPRSFAYPSGTYRYEFPTLHRSLTDVVASCGYSSGRIVGGLSSGDAPSAVRANELPLEDPYVVRTPDETSAAPITLPELQHAVTAAGSSADQWIPLVFNEVCNSTAPSYAACTATRRAIDDTVLDAFLAWLRAAGEPGGAPAGTTVQTVRQVLGDVPQPQLPAPPTVVSLTFDDGDAAQAVAGPLLRARGLHGTFYVNAGKVDAGNAQNMTWSQIARLHADGDEIGGHGANHLDLTDPGMSDAVRRQEVCGERDRLVQLGFDPVSFAYPFSASDPAVKRLVESCGYTSGRSGGGLGPEAGAFAESIPPGDPFAIQVVHNPPGGPWTLAALQDAVVRAADHGGGWVPFAFHRICVEDAPTFAACMSGEAPLDVPTFAAFLDWLQRGAPAGTTVQTVREVMGLPR
jgi:peptidoglycan/xylan/chitin deacetylase (PgdA/CDA1 family)